MFYVYIIESERNRMWYYGHSENPERRVAEHNTGLTKSTRNKGPWRIVFKKPFVSKIEAARFELGLKKTRNKDYILAEYKEYFIGA